jgi:hypothetical protein
LQEAFFIFRASGDSTVNTKLRCSPENPVS